MQIMQLSINPPSDLENTLVIINLPQSVFQGFHKVVDFPCADLLD